jgi:hypothetical protein
MLGDVDVHDAPTPMQQHDQNEQHPAGERRHGEEIHRRSGREMIPEERLPRLRGLLWAPFQQTRHRAF